MRPCLRAGPRSKTAPRAGMPRNGGRPPCPCSVRWRPSPCCIGLPGCPLAAISLAVSMVLAISSAGAKTSLTMPQARAFWAVIVLPVKISSLALLGPIKRARFWVPPKPGMMPSPTSGRPSLAFFRGVDEVAGQGQFQAAPQGEAIHRGNHRFLHLLDEQHHPLTGPHKGMRRKRVTSRTSP